MKPSRQTIFELFDRQRRYVVPLFQRPYVWREEQEWLPLWEDLLEKASAILRRDACHPHFLGAVVLHQIPVFGKHIDAAEVIDGQQRLTTFQVLLAALRNIAKEMGAQRVFGALVDLTKNRHIADGDEDAIEQFKVWPTNADRPTFESVMTFGSPDDLKRRHPQTYRGRKLQPRPRLVEAYLFFHAAIKGFIGNSDDQIALPNDPLERLDAMFEAFRRYLHVVVIELEDEDDPQVIFETLNARGVPLLPSDLVRNYVFLWVMIWGRTSVSC